MERKTTKFYRDALRKDILSASSVIKEVLEKYYFDKKYKTAYVNAESNGDFWNCKIEGIGMNKEGKIYVRIYWQGDSTDGYDSCWLNDLLRSKEVVIPAEYSCGYEKHSKLRIEREWLTSAFNSVADSLEPSAIKARKEAEIKYQMDGKASRILGNELYEKYASRWGGNDKYYQGTHNAHKYVADNYLALAKMSDTEFHDAIVNAFMNGYKR